MPNVFKRNVVDVYALDFECKDLKVPVQPCHVQATFPYETLRASTVRLASRPHIARASIDAPGDSRLHLGTLLLLKSKRPKISRPDSQSGLSAFQAHDSTAFRDMLTR